MRTSMHVYSVIILCAAGALFNNCAYHSGEEPVPSNRDVRYSVDVKPILIKHCYSCHTDTSTHPDRSGYAFFNDFNELKKELKPSTANTAYTILVARLKYIESPGMPYKQTPLSDSLIQVIQDWILIGAPEN
ncbi:hypothetical protein [Cytophaga hutchinsonii]|uniref:Cytochrome C Planctomycete-type domain-containing protein n=1 Tax=Cytophaga hutchinsonii (strain ATCC 33406 / DSM 1761 / CIP 103989 / NBRC 15051 / NCIMB 9469 / D465) TaxID=269798 RepID=A0A6N4SN08_CYTH3|nr:hypothetical protein [Cytophaga hutchinsonii]ABG57638.1 conserved hypothetical protein [Cytophaga hutchinsonii ATCC 33406]SFX01704.1 hypothetical protein SAMN04487930_101198 [Cytophaga hutchinsonii ATCC 33406]